MFRTSAAIVGSLLLLGMLLACGGAPPKVEKVRTRDELKKELMGKSKDEVRQALGVPHSTSESGNLETWQYRGITQDPNTDKVDMATTVLFARDTGKVRDFWFTP